MRKVITRIQLFKDPGSAFGNQVEGFLDVKEDADFPINFSIGDIRDISKRSGSFSKTIKLSGSKNNNLLLNNYFEVNVKGSNQFNLNKKQRCAVIQNGVVILDNCYLRLINTKKVQSNSGHIDELVDYEVEIRDSVGDFFNEINNKELSDLNISEFNHIYNTTNIINSFSHSYVEGYSYTLPWIGNDNEYSISELVPGMFAKTYWDKIHSEAGFVYDWDELSDNNVRFDKLFIPYSGDKKKLLEEDKEFNEVIADSSVILNTPASVTNFQGSNPGPGFFNQVPWFHTLTDNEIKDNQNIFNDTTSVYTNPFVVETPNSLVYEVEIDFDYILQNDNAFNVILGGGQFNTLSPRLRVRNSANVSKGVSSLRFNNLGSSSTVQNVCNLDTNNERVRFAGAGLLGASFVWPTGDTLVANGSLTLNVSCTNLNIGEQLRLGIEGAITQGAGAFWYQSATFNAVYMKPKFRINNIKIRIVPSSDDGILPGTLLNMNRFIPKKVKQNEFVKSIIQKYNLYVEVDKFNPNRLIYKSRDKYYDEGDLKDWTYILAKDREQILEFVPEIKNKRTILSYKDDDNDGLLKTYKDEIGETYGQIEVIFDNENTRGLERKDEIFSPTMNLYSDFGANLPVLTSDFKYNIRVLLHNGVRNCGNFSIKESNNLTTNINYYPFISMLDEPENPNFDISYGINDYYPYDIINFTSNNLYTNFWRRTFAQINSGKMMTAYFWLNEEDIFKLKLSDKIKVNNALWYINKVIDYKANRNVLTKVELLSVEDDLRLPRFGRIVRPVIPGALPAPVPGPVKPVGPIRPILDAVKDVIRIRNNYTSVEGNYNGGINLGTRNVINGTSVVIGSGKTIEESGFFIEDTKLVNGGLVIDERTYITSDEGINIGGINVSDEGIKLNGDYILDGYWDDDYVVSGETASFSFEVDGDTGETTINITADNVLVNGVPIGGSVLPKINRVSANSFNVADFDLDIFLVGNGSSNITIYLPDLSSTIGGEKLTFKDYIGIANTYNIEVVAFTGSSIDSLSSYTMSIDFQSITIVNSGNVGYGWFII
jgi:hypothetical protein